jgi:hypoxanthine phosphoribosyltransferase
LLENVYPKGTSCGAHNEGDGEFSPKEPGINTTPSNFKKYMHSPNKEIVLDKQTIQNRVQELGQEITKDYQDKELVVIGVLKGAFVFMADLVRAIDLPISTDFIQVSSYGGSASSSGKITLVSSPGQSIESRHVLLVEDIIDTGLTMRWLATHFSDQGAASVKICSLIDKAERREHEITIDYAGFAISQGFLIGYGLDYDEKYRNLPAIYHLNL